ncbi:MAG: PaaI family thioesterase [Acidimicrobiales bacterium]
MSDERRVRAASQLRELGHEFVSRELSEAQLEVIEDHISQLLELVSAGEPRRRVLPSGSLAQFKMAVPEEGRRERHQLFSDSIVSGGANPMGLGGYLWREGNVAVMEVTLGKAFEGAPGRAHGGIVAALIDETMGLVLAINDELAFTVQLDITYIAPTPINQPITARAWLEGRDGRKLSITAKVTAQSSVIAEAKALFIAVDPEKFLERLSSVAQ